MNADGTVTVRITGHTDIRTMRLRHSSMGEPLLGMREAEILRGGSLRDRGRPTESVDDFIAGAAEFLEDYEVKGFGLSCVYLQRKRRLKGPYPSCRSPERCNLKGYCDKEISCNE